MRHSTSRAGTFASPTSASQLGRILQTCPHALYLLPSAPPFQETVVIARAPTSVCHLAFIAPVSQRESRLGSINNAAGKSNNTHLSPSTEQPPPPWGTRWLPEQMIQTANTSPTNAVLVDITRPRERSFAFFSFSCELLTSCPPTYTAQNSPLLSGQKQTRMILPFA